MGAMSGFIDKKKYIDIGRRQYWTVKKVLNKNNFIWASV